MALRFVHGNHEGGITLIPHHSCSERGWKLWIGTSVGLKDSFFARWPNGNRPPIGTRLEALWRSLRTAAGTLDHAGSEFF